MSYKITYVATAGQYDYAIPFDYIDISHLTVSVNATPITTWDLIDSSNLRIDTITIAGGEEIKIERSTPINEAIVSFQSPSILRSDELSKLEKQLRFALQEQEITPGTALLKNATATAWDAGNTKIENLGAPTADNDAATKAYTDTIAASSGIFPDLSASDIGKGFRVASGPTIPVAEIQAPRAVFRIPSNPMTDPGYPSASGFNGEPIGDSGTGNLTWQTLSARKMELELISSRGTPTNGTINLGSGSDSITMPAGSFRIEAFGNIRSLTVNPGSTAQNFAAGAIYRVDNNSVIDQFKTRALGFSAGSTKAGLGSCGFFLQGEITSASAMEIDLRLSVEPLADTVLADFPLYVVVTEVF